MAQDKGFTVMHRSILIIHHDLIVTEDDIIRRNGIEEWYAVSDKGIVLNEDILMITHFLLGGILDLRVNGDDTFRKLVTADEVMLKEVVADNDVATASAFIPALRIPCQQDGRPAAADEFIPFYQHRLRCGEQRTAGAVCPHRVMRKVHRGVKIRILHRISHADTIRQWLLKCHPHGLLVHTLHDGGFSKLRVILQRFSLDELKPAAHREDIEAHRLWVHEFQLHLRG